MPNGYSPGQEEHWQTKAHGLSHSVLGVRRTPALVWSIPLINRSCRALLGVHQNEAFDRTLSERPTFGQLLGEKGKKRVLLDSFKRTWESYTQLQVSL